MYESKSKELVNGKMVTVTFRANEPSEEGLQRCANTILKILDELGQEKRAGL